MIMSLQRCSAHVFFLLCLIGPITCLAQQPNIVLILADDLGYGDLSSYGARDIQTPHIDELIQNGLRFNNFYANSPVCSPTRAALITGRYPSMVGVPGVIRTHGSDSWGYLDPSAITMPQVLKQAGYHTALVGKWHLGLESPNVPGDKGFDFFKGFLGDMMDDYYTHDRHGINYMRENEDVIDPEGHATDLFSNWAAEYIHQRSESDAPFFLFLSYNAPHTPIQPPEEWVDRVKEREPDISDHRARLVALIEHMDFGVGNVINALRDSGEDENTIVVFTSDNGGQLNVGAYNGPLRDGKQSVYEGGLKVPTTIVWPGVIDPGSQTEYMALSMDLFPTFVEAAGLEVTHYIEGVSMLPLLRGVSNDQVERDLFFSRREGGTRYGGKTIEAIRRGEWKLLQNSPFGPQELYNVSVDPMEENNVIEEEVEVFQVLSNALREHIRRAGGIPWQKR